MAPGPIYYGMSDLGKGFREKFDRENKMESLRAEANAIIKTMKPGKENEAYRDKVSSYDLPDLMGEKVLQMGLKAEEDRVLTNALTQAKIDSEIEGTKLKTDPDTLEAEGDLMRARIKAYETEAEKNRAAIEAHKKTPEKSVFSEQVGHEFWIKTDQEAIQSIIDYNADPSSENKRKAYAAVASARNLFNTRFKEQAEYGAAEYNIEEIYKNRTGKTLKPGLLEHADPLEDETPLAQEKFDPITGLPNLGQKSDSPWIFGGGGFAAPRSSSKDQEQVEKENKKREDMNKVIGTSNTNY